MKSSAQTAIGAGTLALGALIIVGATMISTEAGYGGVGPNFLPWLTAIVLTVCGAWIVWEARSLGMPRWQIARMAGNVGFDTLLGLIPVVGMIPDFFFRSNSRNLKIILKWLDKHHPGTGVIEGQVVRR